MNTVGKGQYEYEVIEYLADVLGKDITKYVRKR